MSMIGNLARVSAAQLEALHNNPNAVTGFLYPETDRPKEDQPNGLWFRLFRNKEDAKPPRQTKNPEALRQDDAIDLDKAWHCLHFLLTGSAWEGDFPQGFLVSCGRPVGEVDVGYGPARSYSPEEVIEIAAFVKGVDEANLRASLNLERMKAADIYPGFGNDGPFPEKDWEYVLDAFRSTKEFVLETAEQKLAMLVYIN